MSITSINRKVLGPAPDLYEGSYRDIFTHVNFKFSVFPTHRSKSQVGRPKYPAHAFFGALVPKNLALNSSFRTFEALLVQYLELTEFLGSNPTIPPIDSELRRYQHGIL
ncbi:MAG: hypothetical protein ACTSRS_20290 [Candidatus Helarchaeota archaeon]